jgi:2-amino-4-hydroxy-6-hydroxymethyldihydropteridine diphosphokinase
MTRALLALGSNLGDRTRYLRDAVAQLPDLAATSRVYETEPVGGPDEQGPYLNMVARLETDLDPRELLQVARNLEEKAERKRVVHWGPRTLDVDVLWIDGVTVDDPDLVVPHPRLFERAFVLAPLEDVAPDLVPAGWRQGFEPLRVWARGRLDDLPDET